MANRLFYGALLLTCANLFLRAVGTGFQVYLSGRIGAAGVGVLHLVLSVRGMAYTFGLFGVRTAALYLGGEGRGLGGVRRGCFGYTAVFSAAGAAVLWGLSGGLAESWGGGAEVRRALRACAVFLGPECLCAVLSACFTAAGRIKTLVAVEVLEQVGAVGAVALLLHYGCAGVPAVVLGNGAAALGTLGALTLLFPEQGRGGPAPLRRIVGTALPLGAAECLRAGLNTVENLIVPRRLALWAGTSDAMADFGVVCGMVFPVLMFPAAVLFALAELLVPELPRCVPGGRRVPYLVGQGLRIALLYGLAAGGFFYCAAGPLGALLYGSTEAAKQLRLYAPLAPVLYMDAIADAMCKGLGQQRANARYNLVTSLLDTTLLWTLLPRLGLGGYYFSFATSHIVNFALSLRRLLQVSGVRLSPSLTLRAGLGAAGAALAASLLPDWSSWTGGAAFAGYYLLLLACAWTLLGVVGPGDLRWLGRLAAPRPQRGSRP
ncbi:MAG: hypothetical protein HFF90_09560 [Oscillibacter sp.]|nr:hypothetical protein [Oscillibacter sp.]